MWKSLWNRIKSLFRANAHAALDSMEDPLRMADEYMRQLQSQYEEAKRSTAETMGVLTRLGQKRDENRKLADDWERKAVAALNRGDEEMAKQALARKRQYATTASEFATQHETHEAQVRDIRAALTRLETKISEARAKRDLLKAKTSRANSQEAISKTLQGVQGNPAIFERLDSMEERIDERMYKAEAMAKLETDSLENRFSDLEKETAVEDELAMLKEKLGHPKS